METAIQGSAFYSQNFNEVKFVKNGIFCIDEKGYIDHVYEEGDKDYQTVRDEFLKNGKLRILSDSEIMLPGFVDLHVHAPQWPQSGTALDRPLEEWLGEYTFPLEAK